MSIDLWGMVRFGIGTLTSKDGQGDKIGATPGPKGVGRGQETVARYYPWGFDSRSPSGGRRLCVAPSGGSNLALIGERNDKAKPDYDDEDWTATFHNEVSGTWVKLRKDGGVQVGGKGSLVELKADGSAKISNAKGASVELIEGVVRINGGNVPANRRGDPVVMTADFLTWLQGLATKAMYPTPIPPSFATTDGGNMNVTMP